MLMELVFLVCCILVLVLAGLSCAPEGRLEISVTEIDDVVIVENVGSVDCLVFVTSPEDEQQFGLAVGEDITVTDISQSIDVSAVTLWDQLS